MPPATRWPKIKRFVKSFGTIHRSDDRLVRAKASITILCDDALIMIESTVFIHSYILHSFVADQCGYGGDNSREALGDALNLLPET